MDALLLMLITFIGYIAMYRIYGKFLSEKIFKLSEKAVVPSLEFKDGIDYTPTKKEIIFGHHYTSIAGTGPIVGPAIAIIWGWVPAVLWIFLGSIFMGAVHDLGALVISLRNQGKSISEYTSKYINNRTRKLFFIIVFFHLWIVIAIFGLVIAIVFHIFPSSVFPVWFQIPIAFALGYLIYVKKIRNILIPSIIALILMYLTTIIGYYFNFRIPELFGIPATGIWTLILFIYVFFASVFPVTTLLQPRDYINSQQLVFAMLLIVLGIFSCSFTGNFNIVAPAFQKNPAGAPSLFPFLFITIACGAISGFHSLVSSGTSSKQLKNEKDALFVGYGSMLLEGALAILVVIAVSAGIGLGYKGFTGINAWTQHYASWSAAQGMGSKLNAFVTGASNIISRLGIPDFISITIMGVFVASFASTTLDTATRIQRYVVSEIFCTNKITLFKNRYIATLFAIISSAILAFASGANGKGALTLWPLFGTVNQVLAGLSLAIITVYLKNKGGKKWMISGLPAIFMITVTVYTSILNEISYIHNKQILLAVVGIVLLIIIFQISIETLIKIINKN